MSVCLGALVGDYQGSVYEFHYTGNYDFDFDNPKCKLTDDSVMTLAVLDLLLNEKDNLNDKTVIKYFRKWFDKYPECKHQYGLSFRELLWGDIDHNKSWGNGAAMRISPVGWIAKSEEEVKELSQKITYPSHDHPESYKAAETVAMLIFYATHGYNKQQLCKYACERYALYPDKQALIDSNHGMGNTGGGYDESCMKALPQALTAFFLTDTFDDCLRLIVSSGGDCDTTGAIACSIAEAYYGYVGKEHEQRIMKKLEKDPLALELLSKISK
ncbi:MAG: ADP-ribosylglycohydrolase family protein [Bacilli bacterium]|nr:ADP-ribosylglycohydrolase family protein [Bacilli bacterium]